MIKDYDSTKRIGYFYNSDIGKYSYGPKHIMDPKRISMTHSLIVGYGLYRDLDVYETREASKEEMVAFHSKDYLDYLENYVSQDKIKLYKQLGLKHPVINEDEKHNQENKKMFAIDVQADCPGFEGLWTFCQLSTGGSIDAAHLIMNNMADIAVNYGGGLHHAKKREAYGFCYINDIVICILELLKQYVRVLYIDIDVHHGDGVEEAFFLTNRVMTVSFHEFGNNFFPGTGGLSSVGEKDGLYHAINVPLMPGMTDDMYRETFQTVITAVLNTFKPDCVVLQCGADSIAHDKIGHFNMSIKGHGECVKFMMKQGIPLIVLGGGGYTINNVSRCWAYETGILVGKEIGGKIPDDDYFSYMYSQSNQLHFPIMQNCENQNKQSDIDKITSTISQYLKEIEARPGFQFHDIPIVYQYDSDIDIEQEEDQTGNKFYEDDKEVQFMEDQSYMKPRKMYNTHKKELCYNDL